MARNEHFIAVAIVTPKLNYRVRLFWIQISFSFAFISCSVQAEIPTVVDDRIEAFLLSEAARIVAVSEDRDNFSHYQFFLSEFPRPDLLGISVGNRQIYISYKLASRALTDSNRRWLLRQTVAHEIAHETAGHAMQEGVMWSNAGTFSLGAAGGDIGLPWYVRLYNYSTEKELDADLKGLGYWNNVGWDCQIWVRILENFQKQNYSGDEFHPTDKRLQQARNVCDLQRDDKSSVHNASLANADSDYHE